MATRPVYVVLVLPIAGDEQSFPKVRRAYANVLQRALEVFGHMNAVVLYESRTGYTQQAAEYIAGACKQAGVEQVALSPVSAPDLNALAVADVVFVGTWTDGLILFGHRPGGMKNIRRLPAMDRMAVAVYCTYAVNPGSTLRQLAGTLERHQGADIVGREQFKRNDIANEVGQFVDDVLASVVSSSR